MYTQVHVIRTGNEALRMAALILANQGKRPIGVFGKSLQPGSWDSEGRMVLGADTQNVYLLAKDGLQRIATVHYDSGQNQAIDLASKSAKKSQWLETLGKVEIVWAVGLLAGPFCAGMGWAVTYVGYAETFAGMMDTYVEHKDEFDTLKRALIAAYQAYRKLQGIAPGLGFKIAKGLWDRSDNLDNKSEAVTFKEVLTVGFEAISFLMEFNTKGKEFQKDMMKQKVKLVKGAYAVSSKLHRSKFQRLTSETLIRIGVSLESIPDVLGIANEPGLFDPRVCGLLEEIAKQLCAAMKALGEIKDEKPADDRDLRSEFNHGVIPHVAGQKLKFLRPSGARF